MVCLVGESIHLTSTLARVVMFPNQQLLIMLRMWVRGENWELELLVAFSKSKKHKLWFLTTMNVK